MASFAEALYYERAYGLGQGTGYLSDIRARLRAVPDATQPIGLAVGEYASESDYFIFVYQKGTLFLEALRNKLGTNRFNDFLAAVYAQYRYGFMHAEEFQNAAEAVCACDLQDFFDLWVYEGGEIFPP
jgi:aminopeptidase N